MDLESFLSGIINTRLLKEAQQSSESSTREDRRMPNSTRRAFESRMKTDASVARVAAQNMEDGKAMVNVAQTYTTAIKSQMQSIQEILANCAHADTLTDTNYADASRDIRDRIKEIVRLASNAEFNGMHLMDGTAGDQNGTGNIVQMQAGNSPREQKFMNLLNTSLSNAVMDGSSMNLNSLAADLGVVDSNGNDANIDKDGAATALTKMEKYIDRIEALEAQYSYDYKALDNLSILFEEQAEIFELAGTANGNSKTPSSRSEVLSELLSSKNSSILSGIG
ncbi:MAG: hypothetical protein IK079_05310 [Desulfovibrio sp.]|nr:hypothetical protein [Desulfovibrio sp.]